MALGNDWLERLNRDLGQLPLGQGRVEFLHWAHEKNLHDNRPHRHTFFEVCLVGPYGQGQFFVKDQPYSLEPGTLFVARPGVVHQIVNTGFPNMELFWVCFQWMPGTSKPTGDIDRLMKAFAESDIWAVSGEQSPVTALWQAVQIVAETQWGLGAEAQEEAIVTALLLGIAQATSGLTVMPVTHPGIDNGETAARVAVRFIHDNLSEPLPLADIAAQVYISPRHLTRLILQFTGTTPAQYITHARLDRARALLLHTALPIKEVAVTVGYPDVHHFTRVFSARFGCPPGAMRRSPEKANVLNIQNSGDLV